MSALYLFKEISFAKCFSVVILIKDKIIIESTAGI